MKKIILTEEQYKKVAKFVINEQQDTYETDIEPNLYYHGLTYKGSEINDVSTHSFRLLFNIEMEYRRYGIKDIMVYNIRGPEEMELSIEYYPNGDDSEEDFITLPIDWNADYVKTESDNTAGWIGVHDLDITLQNTQDGGFAIQEILVHVHQL